MWMLTGTGDVWLLWTASDVVVVSSPPVQWLPINYCVFMSSWISDSPSSSSVDTFMRMAIFFSSSSSFFFGGGSVFVHLPHEHLQNEFFKMLIENCSLHLFSAFNKSPVSSDLLSDSAVSRPSVLHCLHSDHFWLSGWQQSLHVPWQ